MNTLKSKASMRIAVSAGVVLLALLGSQALSGDAPADNWKVPARAARKKNPDPANAEWRAGGRRIFLTNCVACHGERGKGDGPSANACEPTPMDLSDPSIGAESDGELYWKITHGKKPMPAYEKLLSDTDRWKLINYLRTLAPPIKKSG